MNNQYFVAIDLSVGIEHHGIKGQKWGVRRYQNADGSLTSEGRSKYGRFADNIERKSVAKVHYNQAVNKANHDYNVTRNSSKNKNLNLLARGVRNAGARSNRRYAINKAKANYDLERAGSKSRIKNYKDLYEYNRDKQYYGKKEARRIQESSDRDEERRKAHIKYVASSLAVAAIGNAAAQYGPKLVSSYISGKYADAKKSAVSRAGQKALDEIIDLNTKQASIP